MVWYKVPLVVTLVVSYFALSSFAEDCENLKQEFLEPQNKIREELNLEPFTWCDQVAAYAQNYAEQRKCDCSLIHSEGPYGENLAEGCENFSVADAVKMWIDEKDDYCYDSNTCAEGKECGHYTQVVSRNSLRVGCAKVKCNSGGIFIICNYDPPGNYEGEKPY